MSSFIRGNFRFVLEGKADIVKSVQKAMADEFIHRKTRAEALIVGYFAPLKIDGEFVFLPLGGAL